MDTDFLVLLLFQLGTGLWDLLVPIGVDPGRGGCKLFDPLAGEVGKANLTTYAATKPIKRQCTRLLVTYAIRVGGSHVCL